MYVEENILCFTFFWNGWFPLLSSQCLKGCRYNAQDFIFTLGGLKNTVSGCSKKRSSTCDKPYAYIQFLKIGQALNKNILRIVKYVMCTMITLSVKLIITL